MTLQHSVSQYAASSGHSASANIYYDEGPEVTVEITSNSGCGWRIRESGTGGKELFQCASGTTSKTFEAIDGKKYAFQIYCTVEEKFTDGDSFTVDFGNGGDSGDEPGGGSSSTTSRILTINQGDGTELTVERTWSDHGNYSDYTDAENPIKVYILDGGTVYYDADRFVITPKALEGYELDYYDFEGTQIGFKCSNLTYNSDKTKFKLASDANASIASTATPIQYGLTMSSGIGLVLTVTRISSKYKDAKIGKLSDGDPIWYHDVLEITCDTEAGYNASVNINGESISGNGTYTVAGDVVISTSSQVKSYLLVLNEDMGSEIKVNRTSSPLQGADTGLLGNDTVIYYNDVLAITFIANPGYEITSHLVNQEYFVSGDSYTVTSDVEVVTITGLFGNVHIFDGETFARYITYIYDGNDWAQYIPWVFDGSDWKICS